MIVQNRNLDPVIFATVLFYISQKTVCIVGSNTVVNERFSLFDMVKIRKIRHGLVGPVRAIFHGNFCSQKGLLKIICLLVPIFSQIFSQWRIKYLVSVLELP